MSVEIRPSRDFLVVSKALKAAGRTDLRKELTKGLRDATKPLIADTKAEALATLPRRGGLANRISRTPQRVQIRTGAKTAGVRIVVPRSNSGARGANNGTVRHPVFGDRNVFVSQSVRPGWFDRPLQDGARTVQPEIRAAMQRVVDKLAKGV